MGPFSYMRSVVDRNVLIRRIAVVYDTKATKCTSCPLDIYIIKWHSIQLHISVPKGLSSGNHTKVKQHDSKSVTFVHI